MSKPTRINDLYSGNIPPPSRPRQDQFNRPVSRLPPQGSRIGRPRIAGRPGEWPNSNASLSIGSIPQPGRGMMVQPGCMAQPGRVLQPVYRLVQPGMSRITEAKRLGYQYPEPFPGERVIGRMTAPAGSIRGQTGSQIVSPGVSRIGYPSHVVQPLANSTIMPQRIGVDSTCQGYSRIGRPKSALFRQQPSQQYFPNPVGDCKKKAPKDKSESVLQKFDRSVDEELKRRRDSMNVMLEPATSDVELLNAVDHLVRAETIDTFSGAVRAAEEAAAKASPGEAEEAAVAGARGFQAEIIDVIEDKIPGWIPIKVIGYVGITRPTKPAKTN